MRKLGAGQAPGVFYGVWSGSGNIAASGIQLVGAVTGNVKGADQNASLATTTTTLFGAGALIKTGNPETASYYAGFESLFASGVKGGLSGQLFESGVQGLLDATEMGQGIADLVGLNGTCKE